MANNNPAEGTIDYIELGTSEILRIKNFYKEAFGWTFTDYGPDYTSFTDGRRKGGFFKGGQPPLRGVLLVIYSTDLKASQMRITQAGGKIVRETYDFPTGKRFHFTDPDGNELAVWSE